MTTVTAHTANLINAQLSLAHFAITFERARLVALVRTYLDLNPVLLLNKVASTGVTSAERVFSKIFAGEYRGVASHAHKSRSFIRGPFRVLRAQRLERHDRNRCFAVLMVVEDLNFAKFVSRVHASAGALVSILSCLAGLVVISLMHISEPLFLQERRDFVLTVLAHRKLGLVGLWPVSDCSNVCLGALVSLYSIRSFGVIRELGGLLKMENILSLGWACPQLC